MLATDITDGVADLLKEALTANGYVSNIGTNVVIGRTKGAAIEAPSAFVIPGRATSTRLYGEVREKVRQYEIRVFADLNDHPTLAEHELVDLLISDVEQILEARSYLLDDLIDRFAHVSEQPGYHESGGSMVGATLTYELTYQITLSDPAHEET
jgi:hypothetical protein